MFRRTLSARLSALLFVAALVGAACGDCVRLLHAADASCATAEGMECELAMAGTPCCDGSAAGEPRDVVAVDRGAGTTPAVAVWNAPAFDAAAGTGALFERLRALVLKQPFDPLYCKTSVLLI